MTVTTQTLAGQAELEAARLLLERMGITPDQLLQTASPRPAAPTFAEYLPVVEAAVGPGTRRVYGSYWKKLRERWGHRLTAASLSRVGGSTTVRRWRRSWRLVRSPATRRW